jgi:hypothetical protein
MASKIFEFDRDLVNMIMKPEYEFTENVKKTTYRLVAGDSELDMKKQSEKADVVRFRINTTQMKVDDETTIKWLENNPLFKSGRIREFDPKANSATELKGVVDNIATLLKVSKLESMDLLGLAYRIFGRKAFILAQEKGTEGLMVDMITYANVNPGDIENKLADDNKEFTWASRAFAKNIIKEDDAGNKVLWSSNDAPIVSVTKGVTQLDAVVEYFSTTEGKEVKQEIGIIISKETAKKVADNNEPAKPKVPAKK